MLFAKNFQVVTPLAEQKEEALHNLKDAVLLYLEDEIDQQSLNAVLVSNEKELIHV